MKISLAEQIKLLKRCISKNLDLDEELNKQGLSYEDLQYRTNTLEEEFFKHKYHKGAFLSINDCLHKKHNIPTVSFFSGCGGLDIGFDHAGFRNIAAIERNQLFCRTIRENGIARNVIGPPDFPGDVKQRDKIVEVLQKELNLSKRGFPGVFHGGPPCQSFSIAANQRFSKNGAHFKRIGFSNNDYVTLLFDYIFYISMFIFLNLLFYIFSYFLII